MTFNSIQYCHRARARLHQVNRVALQWRLLLLWVVASLVPTALLALPVWRILASQLDHSVNAARWATQLDGIVLGDLIGKLTENAEALSNAGIAALLVTLLLSPLLNGAVVAASRSQKPLPFSGLIAGAAQDYGRMLRMLLWAIVPLGIAAGLAAGGEGLAKKYAARAILEADANLVSNAILVVSAVLLLLAHLTADSGRAQLARYPKRTSAVKAWWRGCKLIKANLGASLRYFGGITVLGLAVALGVTALRVALPQLGLAWFALGLVLAQLAVLAIGWMRIARLVALIDLAHRTRALPR